MPLAAPQLRTDLAARWIDAQGHVVWPPNEGFAGAPAPIALPVGLLLDRFGSGGGRFFSPRGANYDSRALPYVCAGLAYTTYEVRRPVIAWVGRAAPWFDEPGGATQVETDATAAQLVGEGALAPRPKAPKLSCPVMK